MANKYQILRMDIEDTPPLMRNGFPMVFTDPALAADYCRQYAKQMGEKLCVKPVIDEEWRKREEKRFKGDDYRHLPWVGKGWWTNSYAIWKDHYPHASLKKPGLVAYTKTVEDGVKDKQTVVRPGVYLNKYFKQVMDRHGIEMEDLVNEFNQMYGEIEIKFAVTEDEIEKVYRASGQMTCHYVDRGYPNDYFPCRVYAHGDLQIAYLGTLKRVTARSLVWPEKKLHSRVYGDIARLQSGLERMGYKWGAPYGAKIKRIQLRNPEYKNGRVPTGCFLVPYIDKKNMQGGGHCNVVDKGDHLEIVTDNTPGSHHCGLPDGASGMYQPRLDEQPHWLCDKCERNVPHALQGVYVTEFDEDGEHGELEQWCPACLQAGAFRCAYSGDYFRADEVRYVRVGGDYWCQYYADMYAAKCEGNGRLYAENDLLIVHVDAGRAKRFSQQYIRDAYGKVFRSNLTNRYFPEKEKVLIYMSPGYAIYCAKSELAYHGFQCDDCKTYWSVECRHQIDGGDKLCCPVCMVKRDPALAVSQQAPGFADPSLALQQQAQLQQAQAQVGLLNQNPYLLQPLQAGGLGALIPPRARPRVR